MLIKLFKDQDSSKLTGELDKGKTRPSRILYLTKNNLRVNQKLLHWNKSWIDNQQNLISYIFANKLEDIFSLMAL